jgi:amino acid transporter
VIGLFIGNIGWSWLSLVFISRLFLAWSFDGVMPQGLSKVSDRFHTPVNAIVLGAVLALIPMYLQYFTSFISAQVNAVFFYSIVWFLAAVSAVLLPFTRRAVYESATGRRRRGIPLMSVLGGVAAGLFAYLGYNSVANPAVGPFQTSAQVVVGAVIVVPVAIYALSYRYHKRRGVDLRLAQSQLPPE